MPGSPSPDISRQRAKVGALARHRSHDDPDLAAARRALRESLLSDHIRQVVAAAPPLSESQRTRLAALLRGDGAGHVA
jgi:hypothetical protein